MVARPCLQILLVVFVWEEHDLDLGAISFTELRANTNSSKVLFAWNNIGDCLGVGQAGHELATPGC